jgi:hypothetical protein
LPTRRERIISICDPGGGIDVNQELGDDPDFIESRYSWQKEVVFANGIPARYIVGAALYERRNGNPVPIRENGEEGFVFENNTNYNPGP